MGVNLTDTPSVTLRVSTSTGERFLQVRVSMVTGCTWVVRLGVACGGEGVEHGEAAVTKRRAGRGVHDRVTSRIHHVTCD